MSKKRNNKTRGYGAYACRQRDLGWMVNDTVEELKCEIEAEVDNEAMSWRVQSGVSSPLYRVAAYLIYENARKIAFRRVNKVLEIAQSR